MSGAILDEHMKTTHELLGSQADEIQILRTQLNTAQATCEAQVRDLKPIFYRVRSPLSKPEPVLNPRRVS